MASEIDPGVGGLFAGLRVIDTSNYIAGPAAAVILADYGADVVKIEPPDGGDAYRRFQTTPGNPASSFDYGWQIDNRGKRGLALDLRSEAGQDVFRRLVAQADVLLVNAPLATRPRLGLEYASLAELNPRLIYASFTAYGETGPDAHRSGFDHTASWARSGLMDTIKPAPDSAPARVATGMGDHVAAVTLFAGIVSALYHRERTGRGTTVMTNLMANGLWMNAVQAQAMLFGAEYAYREPRDRSRFPLHNIYPTSDGRWFHLIAVPEDKYWPVLLDLLDDPGLRGDPRLVSAASRREHAHALIAALDSAFKRAPLSHWEAQLNGAGIPFGAVARLRDIPTDRQMRETGAIVPLAGIELSGAATVDSPLWLGDVRKAPARRAPRLGEHSAAVLAEYGIPADEIRELMASGVVATNARREDKD
jgi:crotonobetainyl-CoA:carnitine CoA-transferase CaiB-like acyl-CoA transferase